MQNLHFEIDHINILKEVSDEQLAIAEVYVCHDGMNHHEKPISIETMKEAMPTLLNKFLVASFDGWDFGGHDGNKMGIIGFFPYENDLKIVEKEGRNYLVANAIISKNYATWAYDIFRRKDTKDVSMEISVLETQVKEDGYEWITKFVFNAVTVLGNTHNPACEGSQVQVFKFSTDELLEKGEKVYKDFTFASRYDGIDFHIPKAVKENAQSGLDLRKEYGRGGTSVGMNTARYLVSNSEISPEKLRHVAKYFPRHQGDNLDDKTSNGWISWQMWGGTTSWKWAQKIVNRMNNIDEKFAVDEVFETTESITIENSKDSAIDSDSGSELQTYIKKHDKELGLDTKNFEKEVGALNKQEMMEKMGCNMESYETIDMNYEEKMLYAIEKDSKKLFAVPFEESEDGEFSMKMEDKKMMKMSYKFEEKSDEEDDSEVYMAMAKLMKYNTDQNVEAVGQTEQSKDEDDDLKEKAEESEDDEFAKMKSDFEELKSKFESQTEEMESLKTFKKMAEEKEMMARVEFEISLVSEDMPVEKVSEWSTNVSNFETVDAWANALKAEAYTFSKTKDKKESVTRTPFEFEQQTKTKNFWEY